MTSLKLVFGLLLLATGIAIVVPGVSALAETHDAGAQQMCFPCVCPGHIDLGGCAAPNPLHKPPTS